LDWAIDLIDEALTDYEADRIGREPAAPGRVNMKNSRLPSCRRLVLSACAGEPGTMPTDFDPTT
jgi:hypothetical protein